MARHMICVKISPEAPTSDPAIISTLLSSTKPVAAAASPEHELSKAITTGISAPPIGNTSNKPNSEATPTIAQKASGSPNTNQAPKPTLPRTSTPLKSCWPGNRTKPLSTSISLRKATILPQKVTAPMIPEAAVAAVNW